MTAPPTTPVVARDGTTTTLRDGTRVQVRAMQPADAARLVRFHRSLSPETIRWRWFSFHPLLTPTELHRLTHVDHHDREAIVALDADEIVGVARWDRTPVTDRAEVAFVITDEWQGRGVGRTLFHELATRARAEGIGVLTAQTQGDNHRMLAVFRHGNPATTMHYDDDGIVEVEMPLDDGEPARFVVETTDHQPEAVGNARHAPSAHR